MSTTSTHPTGHEHGEEAVEIVARAIYRTTYPTGAWEDESPQFRQGFIDCARAAVADVDAAGFLATEQEWGVRTVLEGGTPGPVHRATSREGALSVHEYVGGTVASRRVTAWRDEA